MNTEEIENLMNSISFVTNKELCYCPAFTERKISALNMLLKSNTEIETIYINTYNTTQKITCVKETDEILETLKSNNSTTILKLYSNSVTLNQVIEKLSELIAYNSVISNLDIQHANFSEKLAKSLANGLSKNNSITHLCLFVESIMEPEGIGHILSSLHKSNSITYLNFDYLKIDTKGCQSIADFLCKNDSLKILRLAHSIFNSQDAKIIFKSLLVNYRLEELYFDGNKIDTECANIISKMFFVNSSFRLLSLNYEVLTDFEIEIIFSGLLRSKNKTFSTISLCQNDLTSKSAFCIANCLSSAYCGLSSINFRNNKIESDGFIKLAEAMAKNTKINYFVINSNKIGVDIAKPLGKLISENKSLEKLALTYSPLHAETGINIGIGLKTNRYLQVLNIQYCRLGYESIECISKALKTNTSLEKLFLRRNYIKEMGAKKLADALKINYTLKCIDLSNNKFYTKGALFFAECLKFNRGLHKVLLEYNYIRIEGAKAILNAIKDNPYFNIAKLNLNGNRILKKSHIKLRSILKEFPITIELS